MSAAKRKPAPLKSKPKAEEVNKKAIVWIGSITALVIIIIALLLIFS